MLSLTSSRSWCYVTSFSAVLDTCLHSPSFLSAKIIFWGGVEWGSGVFTYPSISISTSYFFQFFCPLNVGPISRFCLQSFSLFIALSSWEISSSLTASATAYTEKTLSPHFCSEPHFYVSVF